MRTSVLRLVRHKMTRAYLGEGGIWTDDPQSALQFADIQRILELQRELRLTEIEMVLQLGNEPSPEFDIALPFFLPDNLHHSNTLKEFPFIDTKSIV